MSKCLNNINAQVASGGKVPPGLQRQSHSQGARTPYWPAQPATKPRTPTGTHHTQARWFSGKKVLKRGGKERKAENC